MLSVNFLSSILEDNEYSLFISFLPFFLLLYFFLYMYMTHRIVIKECFPLFLSLESSKKVQRFQIISFPRLWKQFDYGPYLKRIIFCINCSDLLVDWSCMLRRTMSKHGKTKTKRVGSTDSLIFSINDCNQRYKCARWALNSVLDYEWSSGCNADA